MALKRKFKIGIAFDDTLDRPDGVQQYIFRISEYLISLGHEVYFLVGETTRKDLQNVYSLAKNLNVNFNGNKMSIPLPVSNKDMSKLLEDIQLDILHIQAPYSPFMVGRLIRQAAKKQIPVVGTFHILPYSKSVILANKVLSLINKKTKKYIREMIFVSPPAFQFAKEIYGYSGTIIPNPIRVSDFSIQKGTANSVPHIVFLGRLVERKGAMKLLEALVYMKSHAMFAGNFKVTIAGKGTLLDRLLRFAQNNGLDSVSFPGFIAENDKASLLESADIVVLPSISGESFGISVVEALAAARGVVLAGNNPGYASVLYDMPELLIDPTNASDFAEKISYWLSMPSERSNISKKQKKYAKQFDINIVGKNVMVSYDRALRKTE